MIEPHNVLTHREKNLCEYGGALGVVLSLTCLVQHSIYAIPSYITNPMIPAYLFAILTFVLLGFKKIISVIFLIISAFFCLIIEILWLIHFAFSLVVLLLFIYHIAAVVVIFLEEIPRKLRMKRAAERAERDQWAGKI